MAEEALVGQSQMTHQFGMGAEGVGAGHTGAAALRRDVEALLQLILKVLGGGMLEKAEHGWEEFSTPYAGVAGKRYTVCI